MVLPMWKDIITIVKTGSERLRHAGIVGYCAMATIALFAIAAGSALLSFLSVMLAAFLSAAALYMAFCSLCMVVLAVTAVSFAFVLASCTSFLYVAFRVVNALAAIPKKTFGIDILPPKVGTRTTSGSKADMHKAPAVQHTPALKVERPKDADTEQQQHIIPHQPVEELHADPLQIHADPVQAFRGPTAEDQGLQHATDMPLHPQPVADTFRPNVAESATTTVCLSALPDATKPSASAVPVMG
mmetsp:Transcript_26033/g.56804  ORF Transcript_26033/g.56804 Transcript_26033/m.56804 type:complete len:243 (-) Transcript_26033:876-1604(-)